MNFKPTTEMVHAAEMVFLAMANEETIRPIVEGYQKSILADIQPHLAKCWRDRGEPDKIILDPKHTYLMEDEDFQEYLTLCRLEQAKEGLKTDTPEQCPLLVAENLTMDAKHHLIEVMEPITHITLEMATRKLDAYHQLVDLTLKLLAPYVDKDRALKMVS